MIEPQSLKMDYPNKCFKLLHATFWDSFKKISKHHQIKCKYLIENMPKENEEQKDKNEKEIMAITESLKSIVQTDLRHYYFIYLKYAFCLSEPLTINQLKNNFKNKIFPYYLFTLLSRKKEINHLIIDFFDKKITILNKDKKLEIINQEKITSVEKLTNTSIKIKLLKNKEIEIFPEFFQQVDLIYKIIYFLMKNSHNNKNNLNEDEFSLIDDDIYIPNGILLREHILKEHQNKLLTKDKRYAVLGQSLIVIFKDRSMQEIRNIIPLLPFATQLFSDDKELVITFKYFYRDQSLTFFDKDTYYEWKNTIKDLFNKKKIEKIEGVSLYQIKEKQLNNKILDLINHEFENIEDKIKSKGKELEDIKKSIVENNNDFNDISISTNQSKIDISIDN